MPWTAGKAVVVPFLAQAWIDSGKHLVFERLMPAGISDLANSRANDPRTHTDRALVEWHQRNVLQRFALTTLGGQQAWMFFAGARSFC